MAMGRFIDFWRRHWILGWSLFAILFFVALAAIGAAKNANDAAHELAEAITELDRDDPGWRLADMIAARPQPPPDHQNSFKIMEQAKRALTKPVDYLDIESTHPPPELLADEVVKEVQVQLLDRQASLILARTLADYPAGQVSIEITKDGYPTFDRESCASSAVNLLAIEVLDRLLVSDMVGAERSLLAMLRASRPFRDEPFVIPFMVRVGILQSTLDELSRAMALGDFPPTSRLTWRDRLLEEARVCHFLNAVRGDRASFHETMSSITRADFAKFFLKDDNLSIFSHEFWIRHLFPDQIKLRAHAWSLRRWTDFATIRNMPERRHWQAAVDLRRDVEFDSSTSRAAKLMEPIFLITLRSFESELRCRARLRCAAAAMAAEEFRSTRMRWPESLDELVTAGLLTEVPLDPFADAPLRFRRVKDGIVIHSVGSEGNFAGDAWDAPVEYSLEWDLKRLLEFRLWDPEHRRQPARPRPKRDLDDIPPEP